MEEKRATNNYNPLLHLVVFKLGTEEYGIRIEQVKEVTLTPEIARMPQTPSFIKGVASIRGDIIAVMDLEERFNIPPTQAGQKKGAGNYTLVIESTDYTIGLVVKEVPQTVSIPATEVDKTPNIIQEKSINENYIEGIGKINGRLIIILDIRKILTAEEIKTIQQVT